jgi:hypothetical protein
MALTPHPVAVVAAVFEANPNSPALLELLDDSICYLFLLFVPWNWWMILFVSKCVNAFL